MNDDVKRRNLFKSGNRPQPPVRKKRMVETLAKEKEDESSRIVFSTYQTMINLIDGETDGDRRKYGVGHFDLYNFNRSVACQWRVT